MPIGPARPGVLAHLGHQLVAQRAFAAVPGQAGLASGGNVALDGLAVQAHQRRDRACPLAAQPQAQHFSDLVHTDLPECHCHLHGGRCRPGGNFTGSSAVTGGPWGGPITGGTVVP